MTLLNNSEIFYKLEQWAPKYLAYEWDNVGLQIGSYSNKVKKILVTLDVLENVVDEAIAKDVDLILSHHPLLFNPLKKIDVSSPKGRVIQKLLKHDITVYTAHTNLDIAQGGVNDVLAKKLELNVYDSLVDLGYEKYFKVMVYVPETHEEEIREAFHKGRAGQIGNYSHCTFQSSGQGTFKPLEGSDPFIGDEDEIARVGELKIESIVSEKNLASVIAEIKNAHPYEEVAYDVYLLQNENKSYGLGRIGHLDKEMSFKDFCEHVKTTFKLSKIKTTGTSDSRIKKVAILGGSGEKFISNAIKKSADAYVTGDITFHTAQEAMELGLPVIDAGHYIEEAMKESVKTFLENSFPKYSLEVICSEKNTNPFEYI